MVENTITISNTVLRGDNTGLSGDFGRPRTAMTGGATLRGLLLLEGIKENVLAAHRASIKRGILPERVRNDLTTFRIPRTRQPAGATVEEST